MADFESEKKKFLPLLAGSSLTFLEIFPSVVRSPVLALIRMRVRVTLVRLADSSQAFGTSKTIAKR